MELLQKKCIPCSGETPPLPLQEIENFKKQISSEWQLTHNNTRLFRALKFKNFKMAFELCQKLSQIAEEQWHHPEFHLGWGHLEIEIWTHKINALVESDFILAAKFDDVIKN
jgi:4a-hydroxytetrahydrobiopterin dehydratase